MRISILFLLLWGLAASVSAQEFTPITCPDETTVAPQMTITLPPQPPLASDEPPESYFVSILTDETTPTLATTDENELVTCAIEDGLAELVSVTFEHADSSTESHGFSPYSTWIGADGALENTVSVGEMPDTSILVIEGGRMTRNDREGDTYTLSLDAMLAETVELRVHVLNVEGTYTPGVSMLDEDDNVIEDDTGPLTCTPSACSAVSGINVSYTGIRVPAYLSTPEDPSVSSHTGQTSFRVRVENTQTEGPYTLIISMKRPESTVSESITAQAIDNGDGSWMVRCDGELAFQNGIKLTFDAATMSTDDPLTLTALGDDSPITMAVFTSPTEGTCVPVAEAVSSYSTTLPNLNIAPTLNGAQVTLDTPPVFVLVGSAEPSALTLLVEGWKTPVMQTLVAEENPDLAAILQPALTLDVTPGIVNTGSAVVVYAIASDDLADPAVGIVNDAGQPVTDASGQMVACNDAGIPDECALESLSLTGYSVTLAEGRVLPGASLDASVILSLSDLMTQVDPVQPRLRIAAADRTGAGGPMVLVIALALGQ